MAKLIEDYLKDLTAYDITDGAVENCLIEAGVEPRTEVSALTRKQLDLCKAYTYLWCASTPSITGGVEDSDSGWSHKEGGKQSSAYDKRLMRRMGLDLLKKYGVNAGPSTIHLVPMGMRMFPGHKG